MTVRRRGDNIPTVADYAHWNEDAERIWYEENRYDMEHSDEIIEDDDDYYEADPEELNDRIADLIYQHQETVIHQKYGHEESRMANYGWGVDEVEGTVETKVYGAGMILTTYYAGGKFYDDWRSIQ